LALANASLSVTINSQAKTSSVIQIYYSCRNPVMLRYFIPEHIMQHLHELVRNVLGDPTNQSVKATSGWYYPKQLGAN
jgi:hypothetical protein